MTKIEIGDAVRHQASGQTGVVVGRPTRKTALVDWSDGSSWIAYTSRLDVI